MVRRFDVRREVLGDSDAGGQQLMISPRWVAADSVRFHSYGADRNGRWRAAQSFGRASLRYFSASTSSSIATENLTLSSRYSSTRYRVPGGWVSAQAVNAASSSSRPPIDHRLST